MGQANRRAAAQKEREVHIDQRRTARTAWEIRVDYSTVDALFCDFTRNINEGGLFIETPDPCPVDTMVKLQFRLPGVDDAIRTRGRVVWVDRGDPTGRPDRGSPHGDPTGVRPKLVSRRLAAATHPPGGRQSARAQVA